MAEPTIPAQLALHVDRLLGNCLRSIEDLTQAELNHRPGDEVNSIGFDIWHVVRTIDNVIFFVFDREQPIWLRDGFDERFGLPRVAQGTGMAQDESHALEFPEPSAFREYVEAVRAAVMPKIAAMSVEELSETTELRPWGDRPKMEHIGQVLIAHGNGHLGRTSMARSLIGKDDLGI